MNTNQIKRFATEARVKLKEGVAIKIRQLGFDPKGRVAEAMMPQLFEGGAVWRGEAVTVGFYHRWMSLYRRIATKGLAEVYEEAAYTWFNRLVAIRILQKNDLAEPILDLDATLTPHIVNEARVGRLPQMPAAERETLLELLDDDTKCTEQFAWLINAWCHRNPIIEACFGRMADYTELLLPNNILAEGGFVYMLNHTDFITDEEWRTSELIGWLYQFYISERKDEVFAKKGKFEADEIPAATQIFTPNWIVKYMVQNTVLKGLSIIIHNSQFTIHNYSAGTVETGPVPLIHNSQFTIHNYSADTVETGPAPSPNSAEEAPRGMSLSQYPAEEAPRGMSLSQYPAEETPRRGDSLNNPTWSEATSGVSGTKKIMHPEGCASYKDYGLGIMDNVETGPAPSHEHQPTLNSQRLTLNSQKKYRYYIPDPTDTPTEGDTPSDTPSVSLEELRVADLACGSGHILGEVFDLLYDLYIAEGYLRHEAIEHIFRHNLTGVDIDPRAQQLSRFALLLKACQYDERFADAHALPRVLTMPRPYDAELCGPLEEMLRDFFVDDALPQTLDELLGAYELLTDAESLGSIMRFELSPTTRLQLAQTVDYWERQHFVPERFAVQMPTLHLILALTERYHALVMNPPYMGAGNMNSVLSNYVKRNYPDGKADLFSVFMLVAEERLTAGGRYGMINMQSWMFLSSFENLRHHLLGEMVIENMLHLGPRTFDELSGEVVQNSAFVLRKAKPEATTCGTYFRLVGGRSCGEKERMFLQATQPDQPLNPSSLILYPCISQSNFEKIPGSPIGYWVSEKMIEVFNTSDSLHKVCRPRLGQNTGDNDRFLRTWYELSSKLIAWKLPADYKGFGYKWIKYTKGGVPRKWYGPSETVINWQNDGEEVKAFCVVRNQGKHWSRYIQNLECFYKRGMVFPRISSGSFYTRAISVDTIYDVNAPGCFPNENFNYLLGYLNSNVIKHFLQLLCPTLTFQVGDVSKVPCRLTNDENIAEISALVEENIAISRSDWDAHETSWDFRESGVVAMDAARGDAVMREFVAFHGVESASYESHPESLRWRVEMYKRHWSTQLLRLHRNEEHLNRTFIEIYGLTAELTPDIPLSEITILQQGEVSIHNS